jgi:hypothetical protein
MADRNLGGAQPGNTNAARGTRWRDALNKALARYTSDKVKTGEALDKIAEGIVIAALAGDFEAIMEIGNRLDGRPAQGVTLSGDAENPLQIQRRVLFVRSNPVP